VKNRSRPKMKKQKIILGSLFFIAVLVWAIFFSIPSKNLEVTFCDVGQGDAALIKSPNNNQMLIDGGPSEKKILQCLSDGMPFWDRKIEFVVLSHPHADHLTGLIEVLERYDVGQIVATDAINTSPEYEKWLSEIKEKKIPYELVSQISAIDLGGGATASVLYPRENFGESKIDNLNNTSVVLRLEYAGVSFLFPGDAEKEEQEKLVISRSSLAINSTFYKVPHHGSKNALDENFLAVVSPKIAIISVGKDNQYGLPAGKTISALEKLGIEIKRTDEDETIKVEVGMDGKYSLKSK